MLERHTAYRLAVANIVANSLELKRTGAKLKDLRGQLERFKTLDESNKPNTAKWLVVSVETAEHAFKEEKEGKKTELENLVSSRTKFIKTFIYSVVVVSWTVSIAGLLNGATSLVTTMKENLGILLPILVLSVVPIVLGHKAKKVLEHAMSEDLSMISKALDDTKKALNGYLERTEQQE